MNIEIFKNDEFGEIRTLIKDNEPWFVGKDVAGALGFKNSRSAIKTHVFDEDKGVAPIYTLGGTQKLSIINESGVYSLILGSQLKEARDFKKWITSEVLPSIRKHGAYMTPETIEKSLADPDFIIQLATQLKEERTLTEKQRQIIGELKPKADYYDVILKNKSLMTITQIAKDYGMSGATMNAKLHDLKVQYKQSQQWLLYSKYHDKGYTHSESIDIPRSDGTLDVKLNTKWTQKGRLFLYELLKKNDILPKIEQLS